MRRKLLYIVWLISLIHYSCKDDSTEESLKLSVAEFTAVSSAGEIVKTNITCNDAWTVSSSAKSWCIVSPESGNGSATISIEVLVNPEQTERTATLTVSSKGKSKQISIRQEAADAAMNLANYHYNLPVIFHVLYQDQNDPLQYVSHTRLAEILTVVNNLYKGKVNSPAIDLTFSPATTAPDGRTLDTPGVEYIRQSTYPIDFREFMNDNTRKYTSLLWDPNRYINVMVYNFAGEEDENTVTLGIAHLPYSVAGDYYLEGANSTKYSYLELKNLAFAYCVSINSLFINYQSTPDWYVSKDITKTLAHELGHYLGLYHVYSETKEGDLADACEDSDYCEDTPTYNRRFYQDWLADIMATCRELSLEDLVKRENCLTGKEFVSTNVMDYEFSYADCFTENQRIRMRHILLYSPLIPGPKKATLKTRVAPEGVLDLPIRVMK